MQQTYIVKPSQAGGRLDSVLPTLAGRSRSWCHRQIKAGQALVNGQPAKASHLLASGDRLTITLPGAQPDYDLVLPIVYQDNDLLVVDKPAGLLVHPVGSDLSEPTLLDFARRHSRDHDPNRPGLVHRIDRNTSGLVMIAKTAVAKQALQAAFKARQVHKTYLALVIGRPKQAQAQIELPLAPSVSKGTKRVVKSGGRPALTRYQTIEDFAGYTLLSVEPTTGRTHQIRAHLAAIGHPIAGDRLYGSPAIKGLKRQFLHATKLEFVGPSGQDVVVSSPLPLELAKFIQSLP